jgi:hypothetical protein
MITKTFAYFCFIFTKKQIWYGSGVPKILRDISVEPGGSSQRGPGLQAVVPQVEGKKIPPQVSLPKQAFLIFLLNVIKINS